MKKTLFYTSLLLSSLVVMHLSPVYAEEVTSENQEGSQILKLEEVSTLPDQQLLFEESLSTDKTSVSENMTPLFDNKENEIKEEQSHKELIKKEKIIENQENSSPKESVTTITEPLSETNNKVSKKQGALPLAGMPSTHTMIYGLIGLLITLAINQLFKKSNE